jgi:uncharacterized membrane protein
VLQLFSVEAAPTATSTSNGSPGPGTASAAGVASSPRLPAPVATAASPSHPVKTQAAGSTPRMQEQGTHAKRAGVLGRARGLAARIVAGTLPFTGRNLALLSVAGLVLLAAGSVLRRRGAAAH